MCPFRNHKAATAGIPEHQMIKVKFPNMQQLTKAETCLPYSQKALSQYFASQS